MPQAGDYTCPYCQLSVATGRGLHSHIMQNKKCRARMNTDNSDCDLGEAEFEPLHPESENLGNLQGEELTEVDDGLWEDHDVPMAIDPPIRVTMGMEDHQQSPRRATVEDEIDEPASEEDTYIEAYPSPAGTTRGRGESTFTGQNRVHAEEGQSPWAPFESSEEWELARWLMTSGVSQNKLNDFLKLNTVSGGGGSISEF